MVEFIKVLWKSHDEHYPLLVHSKVAKNHVEIVFTFVEHYIFLLHCTTL